MSERAGGTRRSSPGCGGRLKRIDGARRRPWRSGPGPAGSGCGRSDDTARKRREDGGATEGTGCGTRAPTRMPARPRMARGTGEAACVPGQLMGHRTDLTRRLPYLLSGIASPTARAPRQFSEKGRSSWRWGTGGESRRPCIAGTAPPRISLPHIDFLPSGRSRERSRNNHPSPRLSGTPGGAGGRAFPAASSAAPWKRFVLGSRRREARRAYGACQWSPAVRGGSFGVLGATPCRWTPGRGRMAQPGRALKRRSGTGRCGMSASNGRSETRPPLG